MLTKKLAFGLAGAVTAAGVTAAVGVASAKPLPPSRAAGMSAAVSSASPADDGVDDGVIDQLFRLASRSAAKSSTLAETPAPTASPATSPSAAPTAGPTAGSAAVPITDPLTPSECVKRFGFPCYGPDQMRRAYNLDALHRQGLTGKGTTVGVIICFHNPHLIADLATYSKRWGLPAPNRGNLEQIRYHNARPYNPGVDSEKACAEESSVDVQSLHYAAPDAKIIVLETPTDQLGGNTGMEDLIGGIGWLATHRQIAATTGSWGAFEDNFAEQAGKPGDYHLLTELRPGLQAAYRRQVTMLFSSGNWGPTGPNQAGDALYDHRGVAWPASDPLVTAVGATRVHLDDQGNRTGPDEVWDTQPSSPGGATGAGTSAVFTRPRTQHSVRGVVGDRRGTVDIALNGSPQSREWFYSSVNVLGGQEPGWVRVAGTSIAAPKMAALVAIAAQLNGGPLGDIKPALYTMSRRPAQAGLFDLAEGCNTANAVTGYCASRGFDLPSGAGSPADAARFVAALAARR